MNVSLIYGIMTVLLQGDSFFAFHSGEQIPYFLSVPKLPLTVAVEGLALHEGYFTASHNIDVLIKADLPHTASPPRVHQGPDVY